MGFLGDIGNYLQDFVGGVGTFMSGEPPKTEQDARSVQLSNFLTQLLKQYQPYMTGEKQIPTYTGQMTAGLTPLQNKTISDISGYSPLLSGDNLNTTMASLNKFMSGGYMPKTSDNVMSTIDKFMSGGYMPDTSGDVMSTINKLVSGGFMNTSDTSTNALDKFLSGSYMPSTSDYMMKAFETGVEKPMIDTFKNTILPSIGNQYAKQGLFYGSDKGKAIDDQTTSLLDAIAMGRADVLNKANVVGQGNILDAATRKATIDQAGIQDIISGLGLSDTMKRTDIAGQGNILSAIDKSNALNLTDIAGQGNILSAIANMGNLGTDKSKELLGLTTAGLQAGSLEQGTNQNILDKIYEQWLRNQPGTTPVDELLKRILGMSGGDTVVTPATQGAAGPLATAYLAYAMA